MLETVVDWVKEGGYRVNNLDATIVAQEPKLGPYLEEMAHGLALTFGVSSRRVNVKATTTENLGFCGRGEGIEAYAVVTLENKARKT
jgi:2-C-methyl-D-erythritol 2,4-cyclodiphosphate synthase